MDGPPNLSSAIVCTAVAFVVTTRGVELLRPLPRFVRIWYQESRVFLHEQLYLRYRSEISLLIGYILLQRSFECNCCCLSLGSHDLDKEYGALCHCADANNNTYCRTCTSTFLSNQVTDEQATKLVCMNSRGCRLDDRFVRKRLTHRVVSLLDRNQILQAAAATRTKEKLWSCPCPDCNYVGFISNRTSRHASLSKFILTRVMPTERLSDSRRIRCPSCHISSCQFCALVWTRGIADHTGVSCEFHATQMSHDGSAAFERWKSDPNHHVQPCPQCESPIEKNSGCNHMTCRCGYEFCWVCGDVWSFQHSYFCRRYRRQNRAGSFPQRAFDILVGWFS